MSDSQENKIEEAPVVIAEVPASEEKKEVTVPDAPTPVNEEKKEDKNSNEPEKKEEDVLIKEAKNLWGEIKIMATPDHTLGWAILVFIINIFLAGIGTLIGAIPKDTNYPRRTTVIMGICQFVAGFIFIGYIWSWIYGGFCIYHSCNKKKA